MKSAEASDVGLQSSPEPNENLLLLQVGGRHVWHQDYGYWYENGCLTPDMGSVFIALDPCTKENGCLRVLSGSHKMGRLDHVSIGNQLEQGEAQGHFKRSSHSFAPI